MGISVALISFNEEKRLPATLEAIKDLADEIIVVDSFSTDNTIKIAEKYGAKIYSNEWPGYAAQKNIAIEKCTQEWILSLDCDEVVTPELAESIKKAVTSTEISGYVLARRTFYMGKSLKYAWQKDHKLRLVRRNANPLWGKSEPHEVLTVTGKTKLLHGELTHFSYESFEQHMKQTLNLALKIADKYHDKGKKCGSIGLIFRPFFAFFNKLIIKRAIFDGPQGIIAAASSAVYVYMKYAALWEKNNRK